MTKPLFKKPKYNDVATVITTTIVLYYYCSRLQLAFQTDNLHVFQSPKKTGSLNFFPLQSNDRNQSLANDPEKKPHAVKALNKNKANPRIESTIKLSFV